MAATSPEPAALPPAAPHPVRRALGVGGDLLLGLGLPWFVMTGFDGGVFEPLHVYTRGYDAPMLWIFPAFAAAVYLLGRAMVLCGRGRIGRGMLLLFAPLVISYLPPGSGFPGDAAPLQARAEWAQAAYGAGWDAARRAIAADPVIRRRLGAPLQIAPARFVRRASWGFMDSRDRSIYATHVVEVVGPKGRAEADLVVRGQVGMRRPPFRWGEPGPGQLDVEGTLRYAGGGEGPIAASYQLAKP